jgi:hypothetical protein
VIPGALIVLAMTLGYSSMDTVLVQRNQAAATRHICGGPTGLPVELQAGAPKRVIPGSKHKNEDFSAYGGAVSSDMIHLR